MGILFLKHQENVGFGTLRSYFFAVKRVAIALLSQPNLTNYNINKSRRR